MSIRSRELLIDNPEVDQFERSSDLLLSPKAMVLADQRWTEGAAIFHDRHFSRMDEKIPIPAPTGANSNAHDKNPPDTGT